MPLDANAPMLSVPHLKRGLVEAVPFRFQESTALSIKLVRGASYDYAVHGTFGAQLVPGQVIVLPTTAIADNTASPTALRKFGFELYATRYRIAYYWQDRLTVPNDLRTAEGQIAERQLLCAYHKHLVTVALPALVDANMVHVSGAAFQLSDLDEAYFKIRDNDGRPTAIISSEASLRKYITACRGQGYEPPAVMSAWQDPVNGTVSAPRISLHGTPWYINDWVIDDGGTPQIWFAVMGDREGPGPGHGLIGIMPEDRRDDPFIRRVSTPDAQFVNVDIVFPAGFALGSPAALAGYEFVP